MGTNNEGRKRDKERLVDVWESSLVADGVELTTPALIASLHSSGLHIRTGAAILLGRRGDASAIPQLKTLLADKIPVVRVEAAMSLALLGDRSGMPILFQALDEELVTRAPTTAADYLAVLGDTRGYRTMLRALRSDLAGIRLGAAMALGSFLPYHGTAIDGEDVDLLAVLREALEDPDPLVRRELLHKVARLNDPRAVALLSEVYESESDGQTRLLVQELLSARSDATYSKHRERLDP